MPTNGKDGGCKILVGDWGWAWWGLSKVHRISLSLITLGMY